MEEEIKQEEPPKRGRGRPKKGEEVKKYNSPPEPKPIKVKPFQKTQKKFKNVDKITIKSRPKDVTHFFKQKFGHYDPLCVFGIDPYTLEVIEFMWRNSEVEIIVSDINEARLDNLNRSFIGRRGSITRWSAVKQNGFIENPLSDMVVCSRECLPEIHKRNYHGIKIVVPEDF